MFAFSFAAKAQTVSPDKYDYLPGKPVTLSGSGWSSYEAIQLEIWRMPSTGDTLTITLNADGNGNFSANNASLNSKAHKKQS